jgi:integrase
VLTYDAVMQSTRHFPERSKPYMIRWRVGSERHTKCFRTKTQAEGRVSQLVAAIRRGEQFCDQTGLPVSEIRKQLEQQHQTTWLEHAVKYVQVKWPRSSAKSRSARADALATITPALVTDHTGAPEPAILRTALSCWTFNHCGRLPAPPEDIAAALSWIATKSVPVKRLEEDLDLVREALNALALKLDGAPAAATTTTRKRNVFNNALGYAVERRHLPANPLKFIDWTPPQTDDEIDWRYVPGPTQAAALITAATRLGTRGRHLAAFYGCLYYAATRPSEAANLRITDCTLPDSGWGELLLTGSSPRVSSRWTDDGKPYEERALKRRARNTTRDVPIPPELVTLLRLHLKEHKPGLGGRVFSAAEGSVLMSKEYAALWKDIRTLALSDTQAATPLADVPYSLRHAGVSLWLASGVDPVEVARRAGHSVAVLYRFYAKVLDGKREQANQKIDQALRDAAEAAVSAEAAQDRGLAAEHE